MLQVKLIQPQYQHILYFLAPEGDFAGFLPGNIYVCTLDRFATHRYTGQTTTIMHAHSHLETI